MLCYLQICITTSTSASLEQILPWMFYHKVIGVSTFFLFVEGKAATPAVSKVLESIPVSFKRSGSLITGFTCFLFSVVWKIINLVIYHHVLLLLSYKIRGYLNGSG